MEDKQFNIFKVEYNWYEGEHYESLLGNYVEQEEFEMDLIKAREFAESLIGIKIKDHNYLGKGYSVECLPEYYEQILWFLINKLNYIECYFDEDFSYSIDDYSNGTKICILKEEKKIERMDIVTNKKLYPFDDNED